MELFRDTHFDFMKYRRFWIVAAAIPSRSKTRRRRPRSGCCWKPSVIWVPPAKSMPMFSLWGPRIA
jgi:hypothetical protein